MSAPLITVEASTGIQEARDRVDQECVCHLTEHGDIQGIVSVHDRIHKPRMAPPTQRE
jgi:hypothetical protein